MRSGTWQQPVLRSSEQMVERTNAHDLEGMAALMHKDYQSEQPFHPARGFGGRAQMKANWGAILTGVPDLRAEVPASVQDGDVVWSEWHWWGTTEQGEPFELRAITQFTVRDGLVVRGRLFAERCRSRDAGDVVEQPIREGRTAPIEARHEQVCLIGHYVGRQSVGSTSSMCSLDARGA